MTSPYRRSSGERGDPDGVGARLPDRDAPHPDREVRRDVRREVRRPDLHALPPGQLRPQHRTEPKQPQRTGEARYPGHEKSYAVNYV